MAKVIPTKDVQSSVVAVTVYESKAQVHRGAKVNLKAGDVTLVFDDIPTGHIDRDGVQVSLKPASATVAPDACVLNGIVFDTVNRDVVSDETSATAAEVASLEEQLAKRKGELTKLEIDRQLLLSENQMVGDYFSSAVAARTNDAAEAFTDVDMWQKLIEAKVESDRRAFTTTKSIDKQIESVKSDIDSLGRRIAKAGGSTAKRTKSVPVMKVHLDCKVDVGEMELLISYMVSDASWTATYDVRVDPDNGTATLSYYATVRQATPEEWSDVGVTISTAKPAVSGRAPDLSPWYAHVTAPRGGSGPSAGGSARSAGAALDDDEDDTESNVSASALQVAAAEVVDSAGSSVAYEVPHRHSIPNSNDPIRMPLAVINLTPEITYASRPSMGEVAYGVLTTTNQSNFVLMPGDANVFVGGQFVTKTTINRIPTRGTLRVGLGADNSIIVRYKTLQEKSSETGGMLSTKKNRKEYSRQITLKNTKDVAIAVRVEHEVPTAEDSRIEVSVIEPHGIPANDLKDGKMVLNVQLKPREEKKVNVVLAVTHPTDLTVVHSNS